MYSKIPIIRRLPLFYNSSEIIIAHYVQSTFTSDFSEKMGSVCLIGTVLIIGMWE